MERRAWVARGYLEEAWRRAREGWTRTPRLGRRRWLVVVVAGWISSFALVLAMSLIGRACMPREGYAWERALLEGAADWPLSFVNALWLDSLGALPFLLPIALLATTLLARRGRPFEALALLNAYVMPGLAVLLGWVVWQRPRPTIVLGDLSDTSYSAFPSGHVAQATSFYGLLAVLWIRASPRGDERALVSALTIVVLAGVTVSRLRLGAHYASDVIGGFVLGLWSLGVLVLADKMRRRVPEA